MRLTTEQKNNCHQYVEDIIDDFEENGKVADALIFVDNLLVNFDYFEVVNNVYGN